MMHFPEVAFMTWAKTLPKAGINLARSGVDPCPASLLRLSARDCLPNHPWREGRGQTVAYYGYPPLLEALGKRYGVGADRVLALPGGTSLANFVACAAAIADAGPHPEVIVERPTYEQLRRIPESLGCRIRRLERRYKDGWGIDLERFARLVNRRTRLAIVSNLHNPSGMRIEPPVLRRMARLLRRVGAFLLVDEVYLECLFGSEPASSVQAGSNVLVTNSLTKAYGLDGLRAGWILGPRPLIHRAGKIYDLMGVNAVVPGERLALAAFRNLEAIRRHTRRRMAANRERVRRFLTREPRLQAHLPPGGNIFFAQLPRPLDGNRYAQHLLKRYSTLVVPGSFFESPRCVRVGFSAAPRQLARGLENLSHALDDLAGR